MSISSHAIKFAAPRKDAEGRIALVGMTFDELKNTMTEQGLPAFRAKQVWHWIYQRGVKDFASMGNLPKDSKVTNWAKPLFVHTNN